MADLIPGLYRYSYSGTDARAYVYFPGRPDRIANLEAMHTISWSVHEAKGDARALGHKGVKGFARGVRTIAGSLILTVIEDHPLAEVMELMEELENDPVIHWGGWSIDRDLIGVGSGFNTTTFNRRLGTTIAPFNILLQYVTEGAQWALTSNPFSATIPGAAAMIVGIELIDEGMVTSIADSVTEVTYSFKARDVKTLSQQQFEIMLNSFQEVDPLIQAQAELKRILSTESSAKEQIYKQQYNQTFGLPVTNPQASNRISQ